MRNYAITCSLVGVLTIASGCQLQKEAVRVTETPVGGAVRRPAFDPLGLPQDTVLPFDVSTRSPGPERVDTDSLTPGAVAGPDNSLGLVYRVQILTTNTYSEGRRAQRAAEEIFDQPVFLDYDLPNFKLRVGSFPDARQAEAFLKRASDAGYQNPWVVAVPKQVQRIPPMIDSTGAAVDTLLSGDRE